MNEIVRVWAVVTHAAQKLEKLAGQGVERNALVVASGAASRSRIQSDETINLLPKTSFESISRSPSAAPICVAGHRQYASDPGGTSSPLPRCGRAYG
jgi:hypothetical protein